MRVPVVLACVFALAGCSGGGGSSNPYGTPTGPGNPAPSGSNTVQATTALKFTPSTLNIAVGDSVTWEFSSVAHTVTFQQGTANAGEYGGVGSTGSPPADIPASSNASVGRRFQTAGTYNYRCSIHPGMLGTINVS